MNQKSDRVMYTSNRKRAGSKNSGFGFGIVVFYFLIMLLNSTDRTVAAIIILALVAVAAVYIGVKFGKKRTNKAFAEEKTKKREYCSTCSDEFIYNNVQNEFKEYSSEENFIRDKQRRIKQLDGFLKNGLIDKAEYMVLKSHYDK